jgi:hypothetical protein
VTEINESAHKKSPINNNASFTMANTDHVNLEEFMTGVQRRNPGEIEFH